MKLKMSKEVDLGKEPIGHLLFVLAVPSIISQVVNALYNMVDRMYIGHISENGALALAGAGICGPIVTLLTSFGTLVGLGGSITMGIRMGEKNTKKAEQVLANSFLMLSIFSVLLTVSFLLLKDKLLMLFGASGATFPFANTYLTIYTTGTFFALMATGLNYFINCQGFPLVGMFTVLIGAGCNILSDPIFIFGFHMGISGAAIATVCGQICGALLAFAFNIKVNADINLNMKGFRPNKKIIGTIYSVGVPSIVMQAIGSVMTFGMNKILIQFTSTATAVFGVYFKLNSFIFMPIFGLNNGMVPIVAYNYGAKNKKRITHTIRLSIVSALCFWGLHYL